jgi:hypothetical protein
MELLQSPNINKETAKEQALSKQETPTKRKQTTKRDTKVFRLDKQSQNFHKRHQSKGKEDNQLSHSFPPPGFLCAQNYLILQSTTSNANQQNDENKRDSRTTYGKKPLTSSTHESTNEHR